MVSRLWLSQAGAPANGKHHNLREAVGNAALFKRFLFRFHERREHPTMRCISAIGLRFEECIQGCFMCIVAHAQARLLYAKIL
jgi:hypothetical protein